ncbi:phosphotransferase [Streptantibioticus silvisoli]|uniref:Phosphotransferase n=1 Tax=Streptantibioticus silvisoli TaxID=2705255 RepID=A0ABT6W8K8_9ACTN|nr:phosphotransferase [Streptantibioticus silvisoli]MDI5966634.1 phosphotransferase [Streptantibioticus silvisoli]
MSEPPGATVPPPSVLDAFGVRGTPVPLAGGQGRSVRVGGYVFKPADGAEEEAEWAAGVLEGLGAGRGFRVPVPLRAADGRGVVDGWTAGGFVAGEPGPRGRWREVIGAGRAFHAALRGVPRPGFLARRSHPWAVADRVAWGEQEVEVVAGLAEPFAALRALRRPVEQPAQLVHGDLTGNVLFAAGRAPAVIDFSPYWRPAILAEAVVVVDGLLWFGLPPGLLTGGGDRRDWRQVLIRALIFRLVAHSELTGPSGYVPAVERRRFARAAEAVVRGSAGPGR